MVDTPKYKSNFVRGLEENNNRILTYVTIFFTFAFLGCLIAFWIYEHRGSRCVFGPSCCYTQLKNFTKANNLAEVVLHQRDNDTGWGAENDTPEIITLDASMLNGSQNTYTFYAHLYPGLNTTGGPSYPNIPESNSGFCIGTSGVSLYFDYYTNGTGASWKYASNLFYYGVDQYITSGNFSGYFAELTPPSNKTIIYVTNAASGNDGNHIVASSLSKDKGFFQNLTSQTNLEISHKSFAALKKNDQDGSGYNPFMDFKKARQIVNNTGTGKLFTPICIEPSSKNLPSCRIPRTSRGYPIVDSSGNITYSQNCSYNNFPGRTGGNEQAIEQLIPDKSYVGKQLVNCGALSGDGSDCKNAGCGPTGCTGNDKQAKVTLKVGASPFNATNPNLGTNQFNNAYLAANIFCGQGPSNNPQPMYDPADKDARETGSSLIRGRVQTSTVPNATKNNNTGVFTLGFK
jgi:hypothetical protein